MSPIDTAAPPWPFVILGHKLLEQRLYWVLVLSNQLRSIHFVVSTLQCVETPEVDAGEKVLIENWRNESISSDHIVH